MKKNLLLIIMVLLVGSIKAQTFTVGGISYTVTVPGEVKVASFQCYTGNLVLPNTVTNMSVDYTVTSLDNYAFYNCPSLTSAIIPNTVTHVGSGSFRDCPNLTSVTLPNSITTIKNETFLYCANLTSVTIPNLVTSLEIYAFYGCTNLTSVTLPNSVITLGDYAFFQCSSLPSITIPSSVTSIGGRAFANCSTLSSITIPSSVTSIGDYAFYSCTGLTSVTSLPTTPVTINSTVFIFVNISAIPLNVPSGSVAAYETATIWQDFLSINPITNTYYQDFDGDGYGNPAVSQVAGSAPTGYVLDNTDCDDTNLLVNPNATEICYNNIDDNCDGTKSEGCAPVPVIVNNPGTMSNFSTALSAVPYSFAGATSRDYRFEVRNMVTNEVRVFTQTGIFARFFWIPTDIRGFGIQFQIRASAVINGEVLNYFVAPITVTSPGFPSTQLSSFSCNSTITRPGATISANPIPNTNYYRFRIRLTSDNGASPTYYYSQSTSRFIGCGSFAGLTLIDNTSYTVAVLYSMNNSGTEVISNYGAECTILTQFGTPAAISRTIETPFSAIAYPNPFNNGFNLNVKSSHTSAVSISVYDMLGRLIDSRSTKLSELENSSIGANYPAGVYNVIVSQDYEVQTVRVVKR